MAEKKRGQSRTGKIDLNCLPNDWYQTIDALFNAKALIEGKNPRPKKSVLRTINNALRPYKVTKPHKTWFLMDRAKTRRFDPKSLAE